MKVLMVTALLSSMFISTAWARSDEAAELRTGCTELIGIYDKRAQKKFLAMQTTSASEALRAGYCLGVVREYLRTKPMCGFGMPAGGDWYPVAERIASGGDRAITINQLLKEAACGRPTIYDR